MEKVCIMINAHFHQPFKHKEFSMNSAIKQKTVEQEFEQYYADVQDPIYVIRDGEIVMMSPPSDPHKLINGSFYNWIKNHLRDTKSKCKVFYEKARIKIPGKFSPKTNKPSTYEPDITVVCRYTGGEYSDYPTIIVEVLSTKRNKDLVEKFEVYKKYDSLLEYVIVEQHIMEIKIFRRKDEWKPVIYTEGSIVHLESIGLELEIEKIYEDVEFDDDGYVYVPLSNND